MICREVEVIHCARDVEIAVCVEALDKDRTLMAQITLHLEVGIEAESDRGAILKLAAEFPVQRAVGQIRKMRGHARDGETAAREGAVAKINAALPVGIGHHR